MREHLLIADDKDVRFGVYTIPEGVKTFSTVAFRDLNAKKIIFPSTIEEVGYKSFRYNRYVEEIVLNENLKKICARAFEKCYNLKRIEIPENTKVEDDILEGCDDLKYIKYRGKEYTFNDKFMRESMVKNGEMFLLTASKIVITDKDNEDIYIEDENLASMIFDKIPRDSETKKIIISIPEIREIVKTNKKKIDIVYKKGFKTPTPTFLRLSAEDLENLSVKKFSEMVKATSPDKDTKSSLIVMAKVLGVFDTDIIVRDGKSYIKDKTSFPNDTDAEARLAFIMSLIGNAPAVLSMEDYELVFKKSKGQTDFGGKSKSKKDVLRSTYTQEGNKFYKKEDLSKEEEKELSEIIKNSGTIMLSNKIIHEMFDGMDLNKDFDGRFYTFFKNNYREICDYYNGYRKRKQLSNIQRSFGKVVNALGKHANDIIYQDALTALNGFAYPAIDAGCVQLSREAKASGVSPEDYKWYQEAFKKMILRKESSIPNMKVVLENGMNGEIIRLDDTNNLLAGEKTNCCQRYGGNTAAGVECMKHAAFADNGRVFIIRNKEGEILGQSWVWFNDNTICFDNFEATSRYKNSVDNANGLKPTFNKYQDGVKDIYEKIGNKLINHSKEKIDFMKRKYPNEDFSAEEILSVTLGKDNDKSKILSSFPSVHQANVKKPINEFGTYTDSKRQVLLAGTEIKENRGKPHKNLYRDDRLIKHYSGENITEDVISRIKEIEKQGHKKKMVQMRGIEDLTTLCGYLEAKKPEVNILLGEDFYYLYKKTVDHIDIVDLVRAESRFNDEMMTGTKEIYQCFKKILDESKGKTIKASLRIDTSNNLLLSMIKRGEIEIVGNVTEREFSEREGKKLTANEYIALAGKIQKEKLKGNKTTMYDVPFKAKAI